MRGLKSHRYGRWQGHRRRQYGGKANLSLNHLLRLQPKSIRKHPYYSLMLSHYNSSEKLQALRINRQCYRLLDKAIISPENLPHLYRTYKIPEDPFFPLFLRIKKDYQENRLKKAEEKDKFILKQMKKLPGERRKMMRFLAELEESIGNGRTASIWEKEIYPSTKKRAAELLKFSEMEWIDLVDSYFESLTVHYPGFKDRKELVKACTFMGLYPDLPSQDLPGEETVKRVYRRLSRSYHPDTGGRESQFIRLQHSRDVILDKIRG